MTPKQEDNPKKGQPGQHERVIKIVIESKEGSKVIVAQGASNHYTDHSFTSDTCCTCET